MTRPHDATRRWFLRLTAAAALTPAAASLLQSRSAAAAEPRQLDEADPAAAALGYRQDSTQVDRKKYPQHSPTQVCAGCRYFQAARDAEWGPCALFVGKGAVHARGWCAAYAAK
ncbi:MAG TPA: high-potential iron-sulfur protein [Steroidobacteraceae bacterium]|nr:high-potential iron-sulfur protein [Steroidobacteraceae bacterium]